MVSGRVTSVGQQARAGDVAGFGTRQVGDKARDLVCVAITLKGCDGNKRLGEVTVRWICVSINRARLNIVNRDSTRPEVSGNSLGEASDRCLCECIDRTPDKGMRSLFVLPI